jgi:hypothetical protein
MATSGAIMMMMMMMMMKLPKKTMPQSPIEEAWVAKYLAAEAAAVRDFTAYSSLFYLPHILISSPHSPFVRRHSFSSRSNPYLSK